jgi:hypothetical protein
VQEHYRIVATIDRILITELLVAAIALIHRIALNGDFAARPLGIGFSDSECIVRRAIVDDEHVGIAELFLPHAFGNAVEHMLDMLFGIIGDDENEQPAGLRGFIHSDGLHYLR